MINWNYLKLNIYNRNDSEFRNICAYDMDINLWKNLIIHLNESYNKIEFKSYKTGITTDKIYYDDILKFWQGIDIDGFQCSILIGDIHFNCYFNKMELLEFDIDVFEFNHLEQHNITLNFMKGISKVINKDIFLETDDYTNNEKKLILVANGIEKYLVGKR